MMLCSSLPSSSVPSNHLVASTDSFSSESAEFNLLLMIFSPSSCIISISGKLGTLCCTWNVSQRTIQCFFFIRNHFIRNLHVEGPKIKGTYNTTEQITKELFNVKYCHCKQSRIRKLAWSLFHLRFWNLFTSKPKSWLFVDRKSLFSHLESSINFNCSSTKSWLVFKTQFQCSLSFWLVHFEPHLGINSTLLYSFCLFLTFILWGMSNEKA